MSTRKKVFFCNFIITILCVLSIVSYFKLPFWQVNASYTLTKDMVEKLIVKAVDGAGDSTNSSNDTANMQDALDNLDFSQIIEEDITISISITLQTQDILDARTSSPEDLVKNLLSSNINNLVNDLTPVIDKTAKNLVKALTKTILNEQLKEQVKNNLGEDATNQEVLDELESLGVTEEYLNEKIDGLIDTLYEDGTTTDSAADAIVNVVETTLNDMQNNGGENFEMGEDDKEELKENVKEILSEFADEEGNLNFNELTSSLLLGLLNKESGNDEDNATQPMAMLTSAPMNVSTEEDDATELSNELKEELTNLLMEALDEDVLAKIAQSVKIVSYIVTFCLFTWAYLILKIILKLGMKNNAISLKLPLWFGALPCWVLYIIPTTTFEMLLSPSGPLANAIGAEAMQMLGSLSVTFSTCTLISFVIGVFLSLFVFVYYRKLRRRLKLMKRGFIRDDSIPQVQTSSSEDVSF